MPNLSLGTSATAGDNDAAERRSRFRPISSVRLPPSARSLIGQAVVASTAAGIGPQSLALDGGPAKDQPVPTVVRCRERRQDVAPN
jgi:hypothetical protein